MLPVNLCFNIMDHNSHSDQWCTGNGFAINKQNQALDRTSLAELADEQVWRNMSARVVVVWLTHKG